MQQQSNILSYSESVSSEGTTYVINTDEGSIYVLAFDKRTVEEINFQSDFLQNSVKEILIRKVTKNNDNYSKTIVDTTKHIFDDILNVESNTVLYLSINEKSTKHKLIKRFIKNDKNPHFRYTAIIVNGTAFYFFINEKLTSGFDLLTSLMIYFKEEFNISLNYNLTLI